MVGVVHDLMYMLPLSLLAAIVGEPYFECPENRMLTFLYALFILGICVVIKHWKSRIKYIIPGVLIVLAAGVILTRPAEERGDFLWDQRWLLLLALTVVFTFFIGWIMTESKAALRIVSALIFIALILSMIFITPDKTAVAFALFLLVLYAVDEVQLHWKKSGFPDKRAHVVFIAPFIIILGLFVYFSPAPEEPYDWNFAVKIWDIVTDAAKWIGGLFGSGDDYKAVIGFSDGDSYWGDLSDSDKMMMTLIENKKSGAVIYLRGKVMDSFDGRNWTNEYSDENVDALMDSLETYCAVNSYDPGYFGNYLRRAELKLKYEDFSTNYIFVPLKSVLRQDRVDKEEYFGNGGNLIAKDKLTYGSEYTLSFFRLNLDDDVFRVFLSDVKPITVGNWETMRARYGSQVLAGEKMKTGDASTDTSYVAYQNYRKRMKEHYLSEVELSGGVKKYLNSITAGAKTDYEKLCRIESVLGKMKYTTSPGGLSEDVTTPGEFLDDFLLKKREGYCSYYCTAFVLLARSLGMPARYVQGFRVPTKDGNTVEVKSDMSHAWPEVYIDGAGWIPFEPTPGKKKKVSWKTQNKQEYTWTETESEQKQQDIDVPEPEVPETDEESEDVTDIISPYLILIIAGIIVVLFIIIIIADRVMAAAGYRRLDVAGRFRVTCKRNLAILGYLGYSIGQGETLEEFYNRVSEELDSSYLGFIREIERVIYAEKPVVPGMLSCALDNGDALMSYLKETKGKRYLWYRFKLSRLS